MFSVSRRTPPGVRGTSHGAAHNAAQARSARAAGRPFRRRLGRGLCLRIGANAQVRSVQRDHRVVALRWTMFGLVVIDVNPGPELLG